MNDLDEMDEAPDIEMSPSGWFLCQCGCMTLVSIRGERLNPTPTMRGRK